jgi:hypothetical protein
MLATRFLGFGLAAVFVGLSTSSCQTRTEVLLSARRATQCIYHVLNLIRALHGSPFGCDQRVFNTQIPWGP